VRANAPIGKALCRSGKGAASVRIAPVSAAPFDPPPFRLEEYLGIWEFSGEHYLTASDAETLSIEELLAFADPDERARFERLPLSYAPTWGGEELRTAIADLYEGLGPEHVLTFAGAEEALFWALQELAGPGDHALVTVPNYQSFETIPLTAGAEVKGIVLERRIAALKEKGDSKAAEQVKGEAISAFNEAIEIQNKVIEGALLGAGDAGAAKPR